jgi:carbamate kinase
MKPIAVIAVGGNSLSRAGESGTFEEQQSHACATCEGIAEVLACGYRVVVTHGNGPQVGEALLRSELAQPQLRPVRLDECDAETEGKLGYLLQQTMSNVLAARGQRVPVVTIVTQVIVESADLAFRTPTKPIGPFYGIEEALERRHKLGWAMVEDSGRGWRRVVASPRSIEIVELQAIRACLGAGLVVIAVGGGGIPVVRRRGRLEGVEAVIDKDRASALLAKSLHADLLLFSTSVERVAWHFGRPDQRDLPRLTCEQARQYLEEGEFPAGSMGPKVEAALDFLEGGGHRAIVCSSEKMAAALRGESGTEILSPVLAAQGSRAVA